MMCGFILIGYNQFMQSFQISACVTKMLKLNVLDVSKRKPDDDGHT